MAAEKRPRRIRACAFAKINLSLRVLGVRPDGYHALRTTFQTLVLHDTLTLTPIDGPFQIACNDPLCPVNRENLVWRAAEEMWRAGGRRGALEGVRVRLEKRIPIQAGLGGGSSDAAAALRGFQALWRIKMSGARLQRIAAALGADVPFFLEGGSALGLNRGDRLRRRADSPASWVVLVLPDFGVSTKDAFAWWDADRRSLTPEAESLRSRSSKSEALRVSRGGAPRELTNDLESPVSARHPEIASIVAALTGADASAAVMSGSGSAVFGLFETKSAASTAAVQLKHPSRRVLVTRTLDRAEFQKRSRPRSG